MSPPTVRTRTGGHGIPQTTEPLANSPWRIAWRGDLVSLYKHDPRLSYELASAAAPIPPTDLHATDSINPRSIMNINRVTLTGNLTTDPDHRPGTEGKTSRTRLRLAVHERVRNRDSREYEQRPNYIDVTVWGNSADACAEHLTTGSKVAVDGRLRWHEWHPDESTKRNTIEVIAHTVEFLSTRRITQERPLVGATAATDAPEHGDLPDEDIPF